MNAVMEVVKLCDGLLLTSHASADTLVVTDAGRRMYTPARTAICLWGFGSFDAESSVNLIVAVAPGRQAAEGNKCDGAILAGNCEHWAPLVG